MDWNAAKRRPISTCWRLGMSLIRKRLDGLARPVVQYHLGESRIVADLRTHLGLGLYRYRYYDQDIDLVRRLLKTGDTFVDGGANIGLFTLAAATRVGPAGRVIAFEPAPDTHRRVAANVKVNGYGWVDVRQQALADAPGKLEMTVFDAQYSGFSSFAAPTDLPDGGHKQLVDVVTLDSALDGLPKPPSVVKLDLEGAELKALAGARQLITQHHPDLLIEVAAENLARMDASPDAVVGVLKAAGYQLFKVGEAHRDAIHIQPLTDALIGSYANVYATVDPSKLSRLKVEIR